MVDQFQFHDLAVAWTAERVSVKGLEKELKKGFAREDAKTVWVGRGIVLEDVGELCSDLFVADIAMQAVITNALEALWEDVLNHTTDETKDREGCILDLTGTMISVPVANGFAVVALNAADRDGGSDDIFGQVFCQPLAAGRDFAFLDKGDQAIWILGPGRINVLVDGRIGNVFAQHVEKIILPLAVDQVERDVTLIPQILKPCFLNSFIEKRQQNQGFSAFRICANFNFISTISQES